MESVSDERKDSCTLKEYSTSSFVRQFVELVNALKSKNDFSFLSEFQLEQLQEDTTQRETTEIVFKFLEEHNKTNVAIEAMLIEEQKKITNVTSLFREDSIGVSLLTLLWSKKEGKVFMENVIEPIVDTVIKLEHPLELDKQKSKRVRKNLEELFKLLSQILDGIAASEIYLSSEFKKLIIKLGQELSIRFPNANLSGLICLRMIVPVLIGPQNFIPKYDGEIPLDSKKSLTNMAKVLQKLSNGLTFNKDESPIMFPCNRFIKRNLKRWMKISHKLVTGEDFVTEETVVAELTEDDLIFSSNVDTNSEINESVLTKQRELVSRVLTLEKQPDWKCEKFGDMMVGFHIYEKGIVLTKVMCEIRAPLKEVFHWFRDKRNDTKNDSALLQMRELERYNEYMVAIYKRTKFLFFDPRDFVLLQYSDIFPEDNFAVICCSSVERADVQPTKGVYRAEMFSGYLMRQNNDTVSLTFIFHGDGKGLISKLPQSLTKKACVLQAKIVLKCKADLEAKRG